jgi:crossover junction endodeoxyribonuclease RuvC
MRVLGIDTSLRSTGVAVVDACGSTLRAVECAVLRIPAGYPLSACLGNLQRGLNEIIARAKPEVAAVEGVFYCRNAGTALILGEARGVAIVTCVAHGLPVYEYEPRRVKQAVVGYGAASKSQVQAMVTTLLGLRSAPQEDIGDALALAICHSHQKTVHQALKPSPI